MPLKPLDKKVKKHVIAHYITALKNWCFQILSRFRLMYNAKYRELYHIIQDLEINGNKMSIREQMLLSNFLKCYNKSLEEIMIPRSDIKAIKLPLTLDKLKSIITHTYHTRILVYENNLDTILGFVHIRDLLPILLDDRNFTLNSILRQPIIAAQSMKVLDLLSVMQRKKTYISIVVDEYGGTDGIVTTEDIIEKIFDGIDQEDSSYFDTRPEFIYQVVDQQTIITSARVRIETLEKAIGIQLKQEEDECNTIGGLVLTRIGHMPSVGFVVNINKNIQAEIVDATPRILKQIKLTIQDYEKSNIL